MPSIPCRRIVGRSVLAAAIALAGSLPGAPAVALEIVTSYVPETATPAQVAAAQPAHGLLTGISKDFPAICEGLQEPTREDAGAVGTSDRVDIGAPAIELEGLEPGRSYSYCFFVHNRATTKLGFRISATELVGSPDPNQKQDLVRPPVSVGTWIHPTLTQFTLAPGERLYVPYVIDVPVGAPGGTSAGALEVVRIDNPDAASEAASGAGFSITMLHKVFVTFPGGEARPLQVTSVVAPSVLSSGGADTGYVARFNVRNRGTVVETYTGRLQMRGLGMEVASSTSPVSILLPGAAERSRVRIADMPWIGIYKPRATVAGRDGKVEVPLPWLVVLPPWPYLVALALAVLLPLFVALRRWRQRRSEWARYLDEDAAYEHRDWDDDPAE